VQQVRWEDCGTEPEGEYTFFYGKGDKNFELGISFFCAPEGEYTFFYWKGDENHELGIGFFCA
jgi:hypothetical protein